MQQFFHKEIEPSDSALYWLENEKTYLLSYLELNQTIYRRARYFNEIIQIKKGDVVGVLATRGPEYIINLFALWHIGAIYLPLSDTQTTEYIVQRLEKSSACCLLTMMFCYEKRASDLQAWKKKTNKNYHCLDGEFSQHMLSQFSSEAYVSILDLANNPDDNLLPACIFSSSGTTGEPKLIEIPFVSFSDRVKTEIVAWNFPNKIAQAGVLGFIDFGFDASVNEILLATMTGNALYIVPENLRPPQSYQGIPHFLKRFEGKIKAAILLPSVLKGLYPEDCPGLTYLLTMGEKCLLDDLKAKHWFDHAVILNGYGPTETTFGASVTVLDKEDSEPGIQDPMIGLTLYLMETFEIDFCDNQTRALEYTQQQPNVFFLYPSDDQLWHFYLFDYSSVLYHGKLSSEYNTLCQFLRNPQSSEHHKTNFCKYVDQSRQQLLNFLLKQSIKHPRYILKFQRDDTPIINSLFLNLIHAENISWPIQGEIYISGTGLGRYLNNESKNEEKFLKAEQAENWGLEKKCIFKSGDIAVYRHSALIYCNRNDRQIKRNGMLVNLDDIEYLLRQCSAIDHAAVIYHESPASDPIVVAFLVPANLTMANTYSTLLAETQEILRFLDDPLAIELKHRPNSCFFVNRIPMTHRSKVSYQLEDYAVCHPIRLIKQDNLELSQENEMLSTIANIWQNLLEGNLTQLLQLEAKNTILYPLDCTFTELGGDSLLMSLMTQKIWELHSNTRTPVPNDFSHALLHNATISGIQQVLMCYGYQAIKKRNTQNQGLPLFIFEDGPIFSDYPLYECCLPKNFIESHSRIFVTILKNQCRQIQVAGSYHIISRSEHLEIAVRLAKDLAAVVDSTYLTILQGEASEASDLLKQTTTNLHINYVNENTLLPYIHQCHHTRTQALISERLGHLFDEFIKPSFSHASAAEYGWLTNANHGQTYWLLGNAGTGKTSTLRYLIKHEGIRGQVLPLKIRGLKQDPLFETALSLIFPRWQWRVLAEQSLVLVIDDYDAIARFDCPNLWEQANKAGFSNIRWLISCRLSYWGLHQNKIRKFAANFKWQYHTIAPSLLDEAAKIISQVGLPVTLAAYELVQNVKEKIALDLESTEFRYTCLKAWFKREYRRQSPDIRESDYLHQVFETLSFLYHYYGKEKGHVSVKLQESHWQNQDKLPCVHALPGFSALLSLFPFQATQMSVQLPGVLKSDADEYLKRYQQSQSSDQAQSVSDTDIRMLQTQWRDHFWDSLNSNRARYHVLPLQYVANSTPIFIFHPMTGETPVAYRRLAEALGPNQTVIALQMWVGDKHPTSEEKARLYYDYILRLQSKGPYVLMGWSFGAIVAYHVAILLEKNGYQVEWVINLDSAPPEYFSHQELGTRVLDMIHVLAHTAYKVPLDDSVLQIPASDTLSEFARAEMYFEKAITYVKSLKGAEQYKNFCHAMEKACVNLRVYLDFTRWCHEAKPLLKAKYWVFEAIQSNVGRLNGLDFAQWASYCGEGLFYHDKIDADHFSLFDINLFQHLRTRLYRYQGIFLSLSSRLAQYREKRMQLFEEEKKLPTKGIYIPAIASDDQEGQHTFSLEEQAIDAFLNNGGIPIEANCFLIQGDPGSGKSHYQRQLEHRLFKSAQYFPIFISIKPGYKDYLKTALLTAGFTEDEYQTTKKQLEMEIRRQDIIHNLFGSLLLVIFDGYDEALTKENLYRCEQLELWCAKAVISCRSYAVNWQTMREQFGDTERRVQTVYLQPFREQDVKNYLKQYEYRTGQVLTFTSYEEIPNINLIQNPLLLSIAVELWNTLSNYRNRAELYHGFFQKLYQKDQEKIHYNEGVRSLVSLNEAFIGYNQYLAYQYWRYSATQDPVLLKSLELIPNNYDTYQARQGSRLGIHEDGRLTHITFWEYYFASFIVKVVLAHNFSELDTAYPPLLGEASIAKNVSLLTFIAEVAQILPWMQFDRFRHHLFLTVYASRYKHLDQEIDSAKVIAATNAMSILTVMQIPFSGLNLQEIRVLGAYLKGAIFDTSCLRGADLRNSNMQGVVLRYADLRDADLRGVEFGQKPSLQCKGNVSSISYSPNGRFLGVVTYNSIASYIEIWNSKNKRLFFCEGGSYPVKSWSSLAFSPDSQFFAVSKDGTGIQLFDTFYFKEVFFIVMKPNILDLTFSMDGEQLLGVCDDNHVYRWSLKNRTELPVIEETISYLASSDLFAFAFSSNEELASGNKDGKIQLIDLKNHQETILAPGHFDSIVCLTFSKDSQWLASASLDNTVCLWDIKNHTAIAVWNKYKVFSIALRPDKKVLALGNHNKTVCLLDTENHNEVATMTGHANTIDKLAFHPEGRYLVSANSAADIYIRIWNTDNFLKKEIISGNISYITRNFSHEWEHSASKGWDNNVYLKNKILVFGDSGVTSGSCIDTKYQLIGRRGGLIELWDRDLNLCLKVLRGHFLKGPSGEIVEQLSHNGKGIFISVDSDQSSIFWSLSKFQLHYRMIARCSSGQSLNTENVLLENAWISHSNRRLLLGEKKSSFKQIESKLFTENTSKYLHIFRSSRFPEHLFFHCTLEIFNQYILINLPVDSWKTLACLCQEACAYFMPLRLLAETLILQAISPSNSYSNKWSFIERNQGLEFSFTDTFGSAHTLNWPNWFLRELRLLNSNINSHLKNILCLKSEKLLFRAEKFIMAFQTATLHQLVHQLSMIHVLPLALWSVVGMELHKRVSIDPVPLDHIYDLYSAVSMKQHLKRLILFLSKHHVFIYDEIRDTVRLGILGNALSNFILDTTNYKKLSKDCQIKYEKNSIILEGTPYEILSQILFNIKDFSKFLHVAAKIKLFDIINIKMNAFEILEKHFETNINEEDHESLSKEIKSIFFMLDQLTRFHFLTCNITSSFPEELFSIIDACFSKSTEKINSSLKNNVENSDSILIPKKEAISLLKSKIDPYVLQRVEEMKYQLTDLGQYLKSDHLETLQPKLSMLDDKWWAAIDCNFYHMLITNYSVFESINGCSFIQYLNDYPIAQQEFKAGLLCLEKSENINIVHSLKDTLYDFKSYYRIAHLSGDSTELLKAIQMAHSEVQLSFYGEESVISEFQLEAEVEALNWHWISGNWLSPINKNHIPEGQDIYLIKESLQKFNDIECSKILNHVREAIPKNCYLYIIQKILTDENKPHINHYNDLIMMMLSLIGRERYRTEWLQLFIQAGFEWTNYENTQESDGYSIMVCKPTLPELSRTFSFFKPKKMQQNLAISQLLDLSEILSDRLNISREAIVENFGSEDQDYNSVYMNLLMDAINPDCESFGILGNIKANALANYIVNFNDHEEDYLFMAIDFNHWTSILIDKYHHRIFYFDPFFSVLPEVINDFIKANYPETLPALLVMPIQLISTEIPKNQSGAFLIALLSNIIQKTHMDEMPRGLKENRLQLWTKGILHLISSEKGINFNELRLQQLRWAIHYLEETNLEKSKAFLLRR